MVYPEISATSAKEYVTQNEASRANLNVELPPFMHRVYNEKKFLLADFMFGGILIQGYKYYIFVKVLCWYLFKPQELH